jgi:hypothetical protein
MDELFKVDIGLFAQVGVADACLVKLIILHLQNRHDFHILQVDHLLLPLNQDFTIISQLWVVFIL